MRYLSLLSSGVAFLVKIPVVLVVWKVSMDVGRAETGK